MTYGAYESSPSSGSPIELYEFVVGLRTFYYTSSDADIIIGTDTYLADAIKRTRFSYTNELSKQQVSIEVVRSFPVAEYFRFSPPDSVVAVTIKRMHEEDPDQEVAVVWVGRVLSVQWKQLTAELYCEPVTTSLRRSGLRRHYQKGCPHDLYGPLCGVNRTDFRLQGTVQSVTGLDVTVPGAEANGDNYYAGGYLEWVDADGIVNSRTIEAQTGNVLTMMISTTGITEGLDVEVYPGCGHSLAICDATFGNSANYGGTTVWQPVNNPFSSKVF